MPNARKGKDRKGEERREGTEERKERGRGGERRRGEQRGGEGRNRGKNALTTRTGIQRKVGD